MTGGQWGLRRRGDELGLPPIPMESLWGSRNSRKQGDGRVSISTVYPVPRPDYVPNGLRIPGRREGAKHWIFLLTIILRVSLCLIFRVLIIHYYSGRLKLSQSVFACAIPTEVQNTRYKSNNYTDC